MSIDKNVPPYVAHFDGNQVPSIIGVEGTLGTADTGGTARPLPIGVNPATGAMYVQDLSGVAGTTNVQIVGGTFNAGTVTTTLALNTGTITTVEAGTQNTLGTVGTVIGIGTLTNVGNLPQVSVGTLPTLNLTTGTITTGSVANVAMLHAGTINADLRVGGNAVTTANPVAVQPPASGQLIVGVNTGTITTGSITDVAKLYTGTIQSSGTTTGVGTITNLGSVTNIGSVTNVGNSGTTTGVGVVTTVTTVSNLTSGSVRMTVGTITTGSITNVASLHNGTITAGTQNTLGTVGVVNNIVTGTLASVRQDYRPVGSSVISTHTLGTGGGTFFGTILAPSGAGTSVYLAGLSIVGRSGTVDCGISNNVAGSTGAGVYARGFFQPGGGIARDFNPAINLGTNGTIAYFLITAGTVDLTVNYWVTP